MCNRVVYSTIKPITPEHVGKVLHYDKLPEFIYRINENYETMIHMGTWGQLMHHYNLPKGKDILFPRIFFKIKPSDTTNAYELYTCTTYDGSNKVMGVDFNYSYAPISHTTHIHTCISVASSLSWRLYFIDTNNALHIPIVSTPSQGTYLSLPYKYKYWYRNKWPHDPILYHPSK